MGREYSSRTNFVECTKIFVRHPEVVRALVKSGVDWRVKVRSLLE
jgi:hypothetical protein